MAEGVFAAWSAAAADGAAAAANAAACVSSSSTTDAARTHEARRFALASRACPRHGPVRFRGGGATTVVNPQLIQAEAEALLFSGGRGFNGASWNGMEWCMLAR